MAKSFLRELRSRRLRAVCSERGDRVSLEYGVLQGKGTALKSGFRLSVAIPVHNEETALPELVQRTRFVLDQIPGGPHELLFVDDGSMDRTMAILEQVAREDARIVVMSLSRNFGHQAALTAALDHVSGDATVVMDGDLQDVPEVIPQFVARFFEATTWYMPNARIE